MKPLPAQFAARMRALLGEDYALYEQSFQQPAVRAFRVNTNKISVTDFRAVDPFGGEAIPYVNTGFYFDGDRIGHHPYHHAGMLYVQDPGAMATAECVDVEPGCRVLDLCAAPGGKSSQLRNKLGEEGILVSNEIIPSRCRILTGNVERLGFRNTVTTCMDPARVARTFPRFFDLVMVDAPCSGEGMFRKDENAMDQWSVENVLHCAARQMDILEQAVLTLKPGGTLVYATCTFSLEENEQVVDAFLLAHPEFELVPVKEDVRRVTDDGISFDGCHCQTLHHARRFYPHKSRGEGQFMAVLRHQGQPEEDRCVLRSEKPDPQVVAFLNDVLEEVDESQLTLCNGNPVWFTPALTLPKGAAFSCGVTVGEVRKGYVQPHHQLFMALGHRFRRRLELPADSPELERFLRGEEIAADLPNGWAAVTTAGCTVGGIKVVNGRGKNHYPKGLRKV